jgi:protein-tyrosine phosphatase
MTASTERLVPLEGALNFRDLGGYSAAEGRRTRWGCVFRSDGLDQLTDGDLDRLARLGIRLVCDLRNDREVLDAPSRLPPHPELRHLRHPIGEHRDDDPPLLERILAGHVREFSTEQMADQYVAMLEFAGPVFAEVVQLAADAANHPMVFHCTAGKDRTGFAAAVVLRTLGVPEETVYEDFLLTNHYTADEIERTLWIIRFASLFRTDPEQVRPVLGVERAYLEAAFAAIRQSHGSFDAYRRDALGLDDAETAAFRELALESR